MAKILKAVFTGIGYCIILVPLVFLVGCINTKKTAYFVDQQDASLATSNAAPASIIISNDLLSITVSSLSLQASTVFNTANNAGMASINQSENVLQPSGYLVNKDGDIKFPFLGRLKVVGLSESQLEDNITAALL